MGAEPRWRVYYADGSTYADTDGPVLEAPGLGVQAINFRQPCGTRATARRSDFYWYDGGTWWGGEIFGLFDYLARPGPRKVIFGLTLLDEDYQRIRDAAVNDPDFKPIARP